MNKKKDFSPTVYRFKDAVMEQVENTDLFKSYINIPGITWYNNLSCLAYCKSILVR